MRMICLVRVSHPHDHAQPGFRWCSRLSRWRVLNIGWKSVIHLEVFHHEPRLTEVRHFVNGRGRELEGSRRKGEGTRGDLDRRRMELEGI